MNRLVRERTAHINRIKGLLFGQGIRGINVTSRHKTLAPASLVTGDGRPLPERLGREITREIERLTQVQAQIVEIESERDRAPTLCATTERKRHDLLRLNGIGPTFSAILAREVYYRRFANRRQVASYIGLAPSPYDSGDGRRSQGISKAGNSLVRYTMVQAAWLWLRHQPNSAVCLAKVFRLGGIIPHPVTLVPTGSASDGSGGDEWSEASEEKSSFGGQ